MTVDGGGWGEGGTFNSRRDSGFEMLLNSFPSMVSLAASKEGRKGGRKDGRKK